MTKTPRLGPASWNPWLFPSINPLVGGTGSLQNLPQHTTTSVGFPWVGVGQGTIGRSRGKVQERPGRCHVAGNRSGDRERSVISLYILCQTSMYVHTSYTYIYNISIYIYVLYTILYIQTWCIIYVNQDQRMDSIKGYVLQYCIRVCS